MKLFVLMCSAVYAASSGAMDVPKLIVPSKTRIIKRNIPALASLCLQKIKAHADQEKDEFLKTLQKAPPHLSRHNKLMNK